MKKVPNRIQNDLVFEASRKAPSGDGQRSAPTAGGGAASGSVPSSPKGAQAEVGRAVAHQSSTRRRPRRRACAQTTPARRASHNLRQRGEQRQEDELAGRRAGGRACRRRGRAAPEPARRHRGAEHQRGHAGAEADHDAPQQHQLPDLRHEQRGDAAPEATISSDDSDTLRRPKRFSRRRRTGPSARTGEADRQRRGDLARCSSRTPSAAAR